MNIKQALKKKNRLTLEIRELYDRAKKYNSIEEGVERPYSTLALLNEANEKTVELVRLKAAIHKANAPVYTKIFFLSELKGRIKKLRLIPTEEGTHTERFGSSSIKKVAELNIRDLDQMVRNLEDQIDAIQDELDRHNVLTEISFS